MASLRCPKCKSGDIELWATDTNIKKVKTKKTTSLNLNPLKPFTIFNHKEKTTVKKKASKGKMLAAVATGGNSLLLTGIKDNKGNQLHCKNCGNLWKSR